MSGHNQVKNSFISIRNISSMHARMLSSDVAQSLKSDRHFSDLGVGIALSLRHVQCWIFQVKQIHQSTASERTTLPGVAFFQFTRSLFKKNYQHFSWMIFLPSPNIPGNLKDYFCVLSKLDHLACDKFSKLQLSLTPLQGIICPKKLCSSLAALHVLN